MIVYDKVDHWIIDHQIECGVRSAYHVHRGTEMGTLAVRQNRPDQRANHRREVDAASIHHPNLRTALDHGRGRDGQVLYVVYPPVGAATLEDRLREGPLGWQAAERLFFELATALRQLHDADLLHRDLRAENVFFDADGNAVLGGFALASDLDEAGSEKLGRSSSRAPELRQGSTESSAAMDVYDLGCLLFRALSGDHYPQALVDLPEDLRTLAVRHALPCGTPAWLRAVVREATCPIPGWRIADGGEFADWIAGRCTVSWRLPAVRLTGPVNRRTHQRPTTIRADYRQAARLLHPAGCHRAHVHNPQLEFPRSMELQARGDALFFVSK